MIRIVFGAVALLLLAEAAHAQAMCDQPSSKLSPNQILQCTTAHDAMLKRRQAEVQRQQETVAGETLEETNRKLRLRTPVPGEIVIHSGPAREVPLRQ